MPTRRRRDRHSRAGYDDDGRRVALCPNGTAGNQAMCTQYGYDAVSRLNGQNLLGANGTNMTFAYNPAGQIVQKGNSNDAYAWAAAASTAKGYAVNGLNQYTGVGGSGLGYDEHGNLTSWNGAGYAYNAENRLTGKGGTALQYDSAGRLLYVTGGTHLDYDGDRLVGELDNNGNPLRRYVYGPDPDEPVLWYEGAGTGDKRFLAADERGSVIRVQRADGSTLALDSYDEYGQPGSGNQGRFGYTGQAWLPEVGLWYYKARMYAPQLGRFMQTDPIGYADGMNWYNYAGGDPVNNVDPSGLGLDDYNPNVNNDGGSGDSGEIVVTGVNCGLHPGDSRCGGVNVQVNIVNPRSTNISLNDPHFSTLTSTQNTVASGGCGASAMQPIAALPPGAAARGLRGQTLGLNPRLGGNAVQTNLPGTVAQGRAYYDFLRAAKGDIGPSVPIPFTDIERSFPSGITFREGADGDPRIEIPADTFYLNARERIHIRNPQQCPIK